LPAEIRAELARRLDEGKQDRGRLLRQLVHALGSLPEFQLA
jgi:hypothetical protein